MKQDTLELLSVKIGTTLICYILPNLANAAILLLSKPSNESINVYVPYIITYKYISMKHGVMQCKLFFYEVNNQIY